MLAALAALAVAQTVSPPGVPLAPPTPDVPAVEERPAAGQPQLGLVEARDGKLVWLTQSVRLIPEEQVRMVPETADGKTVMRPERYTVMRQVVETDDRVLARGEVTVTTAGGRELTYAQAAARLGEPAVCLLVEGDAPVPPRFLRPLKANVLVVRVKRPVTAPPQVPTTARSS